MRAFIPLLLLLAGCQEALNEGLSGVAPIKPANAALSISYKCEEGPAISVIFFEKNGTATVAVIGIGQEVLYQQPTDSGYHYRNDGFDLKGEGDVTQWSQTGGLTTTCRAVGDRI